MAALKQKRRKINAELLVIKQKIEELRGLSKIIHSDWSDDESNWPLISDQPMIEHLLDEVKSNIEHLELYLK